jgi:ribosomal protein L3 glutamine methyltransferase
MSDELKTIIDFIRHGASRFAGAGLSFGHSYDNALDEATQLVLHALHLPHDLSPAYGQARLLPDEKTTVLALFERRINERIPACYLTGEAWFAGLSFKTDSRALVPRSPIAELIEAGFEPWLGEREVYRALDMCTGSGCIALAMAHYRPDWQENGLLICEVGESEHALVELLPELPFAWVEFQVGQMGVFVIEREDLLHHHERIKALADAR